MEKLPCSIFNDVLGPVMRGPSSSHVAGAARIASMIRQSLDAPVKKAIVDFDVNGALAASHTGHGTDMGFASGLLNMELDAASVGLQNITGLPAIRLETVLNGHVSAKISWEEAMRSPAPI